MSKIIMDTIQMKRDCTTKSKETFNEILLKESHCSVTNDLMDCVLSSRKAQ